MLVFESLKMPNLANFQKSWKQLAEMLGIEAFLIASGLPTSLQASFQLSKRPVVRLVERDGRTSRSRSASLAVKMLYVSKSSRGVFPRIKIR